MVTEEDWQNNEEDDLEDEIVAMMIVREQMQAALEALEMKIEQANSEGATKDNLLALEEQYQKQKRALAEFNRALDQRGIQFLIETQRRDLED